MEKKRKLSPEAQGIFDEVKKAYSINDAAGIRILLTGCEAFQQMRECQQDIDKHGYTVGDPKRGLKLNPAVNAARDFRAQFLASFRLLRIDVPLKIST